MNAHTRTLSLCALLSLPLGCGAATPVIRDEAQLSAHTRGALRRFVDGRGAPAITYVVVDRRGLRFAGAAGAADAATGEPVNSATMFMACSTTKALTAVVVMQLVERGVLQLDAPLSRYFDGHPYGDAITLRMLLSHTAGISDPMPLDWFYVEDEPRDERAALARVLAGADTLDAAPGAQHAYSNIGYWLLGAAIEQATGKRFAQVVAEQVFAPLGIAPDDATFSLPPQGRLARGHIRKWSPMTPIFYLATPNEFWERPARGWSRFARLEMHGPAYGGLFTTPGALSAVLSDLLRDDGVLLTPASKATLWTPQTTRDGEPTGEALGWVIGELRGQRYYGKQGGGAGFFGNVRIYPDAGTATLYLANATRVTPGPIDAVSDTLDAPFLQRSRP